MIQQEVDVSARESFTGSQHKLSQVCVFGFGLTSFKNNALQMNATYPNKAVTSEGKR